MYKRILVPLDHSATDRAILDHIKELAQFCKAELVVVHVADGFVARNQSKLNLQDSEEMKKDKEYLETVQAELTDAGLTVRSFLLQGSPASQILALAESESCDLIAMATHGHRFIADIVLGSVATELRHKAEIPILMIRRQRV